MNYQEISLFLKKELDDSGIVLQRYDESKPFSIRGRLNQWRFSLGRSYWIAEAPFGEGLPLEIATELHYREHPGEGFPETYGQVVRVGGDAGCKPPRESALPNSDILLEVARTKGGMSIAEIVRLCNEGEIKGPRYVNKYHIDTGEGLREFVRVIEDCCLLKKCFS